VRGAFADQGWFFVHLAGGASTCEPSAEEDPGACPQRAERDEPRLGEAYASEGRPSTPPVSALLLQVFYGIRSERQLMEQLDYNLLYRWFVGLSPDTRSGTRPPSPRTGTRLQNGEVFKKFMTKLLNHPQVKPLLSDEHSSVDEALILCDRPDDGNP
jgi:hypothetical protein